MKLPQNVLLILFIGISIIFGAFPTFAQNISLEAEVDKTEVEFGDSLTFYLTISYELSAFSGQRLSAPNIEKIPGFDIVGKQTAQKFSSINGMGSIQLQTVFELVPQGPGKMTIPGFTIGLPGGKQASSKPIEVTVHPQAKTQEAGKGEEGTPETEPPQGGVNFFSGLMVVALVVLLIIASPILLSWFMTRNVKPSRRWEEPEKTRTVSGVETISSETPLKSNSVEEEEIATFAPVQVSLDFDSEVNALKRLHPETDLEFYRAYFDLVRRSFIGAAKKINENMTPDEMLKHVSSVLPHTYHESIKRIATDWESVVFARTRPSRLFTGIHEDINQVLRQLRS